jgi:hypothetical protein
MGALLFSFTRLTNERRYDYQLWQSQPTELNPLINQKCFDYLLTRQPLPELSTLLLAWSEAFYSYTRSVRLQHADLLFSAIGYIHLLCDCRAGCSPYGSRVGVGLHDNNNIASILMRGNHFLH